MPRIRKNTVSDAVYAVGEANARDPAKEWASKCALSWDRRPCIARFLDDVFECGQNDYTEAVSRNLFIGMAARIMSPGCMLHTMVVLESEKQGVGKSSVCEALVPKEWFGVINRSPDDPKFISELQGKVLLEVAEMSAFSRADKRKIKSMLTVPSDFHLLPYAHHAVDLPRHCTFIGTTNRNDYLDDETGNRRFLPIRCSNNLPPVPEIIERVTRMRDQLMGEAVTLFQKGATWHEINVELATEQQNERMEHDAWMDVLADWRGIGRSGSAIRLHEQTGRRFVTISDILLHALGVEVSKQTKTDQMRLTACLKRLGWRRDKLWFDTRCQRVWLIPGS
jgi:putative DNA primase/helicase